MTSTVYVYTMTQTGQIGAWSRYTFPFAIEAFAQLGNDLYVRHGDVVSIVSEDAHSDEVEGVPVNYGGTVQWAWLDFGRPGVTKMMEGFDMVSEGTPSVSFGYDQRNVAAFTAPYTIDADTFPGGMIPFPISAPTLSVKVDFAGGEAWSLSEIVLYLHDNRQGS